MAIASIWPDGAQAACRTMSGIRPLTGILPTSIWWQRSAPTCGGICAPSILIHRWRDCASRAAAQSLCRHRPDLPRRASRRLDR
jgi:hypothetical protein